MNPDNPTREIIDRFDGEHRFLSNFYPVTIFWLGLVFHSVEHAFQASKSTDPSDWEKLTDPAMTPGKAKRFGREVKIRPGWNLIRVEVMRRLLRLKFAVPHLRELLLATGDAILIEGNWWGDTFWGVCRGIGENWLGRLLMEIREEIRKQMDTAAVATR